MNDRDLHQMSLDTFDALLEKFDAWDLFNPELSLPDAVAELLVSHRVVVGCGLLEGSFGCRWVVAADVRGLTIETPADATFVVNHVLGIELDAKDAEATFAALRGCSYLAAVAARPSVARRAQPMH